MLCQREGSLLLAQRSPKGTPCACSPPADLVPEVKCWPWEGLGGAVSEEVLVTALRGFVPSASSHGVDAPTVADSQPLGQAEVPRWAHRPPGPAPLPSDICDGKQTLQARGWQAKRRGEEQRRGRHTQTGRDRDDFTQVWGPPGVRIASATSLHPVRGNSPKGRWASGSRPCQEPIFPEAELPDLPAVCDLWPRQTEPGGVAPAASVPLHWLLLHPSRLLRAWPSPRPTGSCLAICTSTPLTPYSFMCPGLISSGAGPRLALPPPSLPFSCPGPHLDKA